MNTIVTGIRYGVIAWVAFETFLVLHAIEKGLIKSFTKKYTTVDIHKEEEDGQVT